MLERIKKLRGYLEQAADAVLIMRPENRRYLSGFTGSSGLLLITHEEAVLITDFRYTQQAMEQACDCKIVECIGPINKTLQQELTKLQVKRLAFEQDFITFGQFTTWQKELAVELMPVNGWVEQLRAIKDEQEIKLVKASVAIADRAFEYILSFIRPGVSELEIALELEFYMRRQGAEGLSFDPIVASGPRASLPHAQPTSKKVKQGEMVKMDFGCVAQGYCSDITRTVAVGRVYDKQKSIYETVLQAQLAAITSISPGVTGQEVDKVARDLITGAGYGENFGHSLGHGVGLVVHETPRLAQTDTAPLVPGMIVTVEPGIYLPDWGGVRIEDMVLVTDEGYQILTNSVKELTII